MIRDYQRSKVYKFDSLVKLEFTDFAELDLKQATEFVKHLCWTNSFARVDDISIKDGRRCRNASGGYRLIKLPRWSRTKTIICHEMSHVINHELTPKDQDHHGPIFMKIYINLLCNYLNYDKVIILQLAKEAKVDIGI